jgi:hypothetical protein
MILSFIAEEKENYSKYSQSCANYQTPEDPIVKARHLGRMEILEMLLQEKIFTIT